MNLDWDSMGTVRTLEAGAFLWYQDDAAGDVVLLLEGELDVLQESAEGEVVVFKTLGPGDVLGDMSCLDGCPHSASVKARTPSRVRTVSAAEFKQAIKGRPEVLEALLYRQAERIRRLTRDMARLGFENVRTRVARYLLERWRQGGGQPVRATHHEVAARVAATRESVTKALGDLAKRNLVRLTRGQVHVLDPESLQDLTGS
ncbi:MAG: Crp/Fnr family transcriptional regulator [Armatimonadetes bacterium]|nr:Crp/Fnr family transcriptional regulator [Armatimonadota bacterium]